jgi:hypothetical protein
MANPSSPNSTEPLIKGADAIEVGAYATAIGTVGEKALGANTALGNLFGSVKTLGGAFLEYGGVTKQLQSNIEILSTLMKGDFNKAVTDLTSKLKSQITAYQALDVQFAQLGKGENSKAYIENIRKQQYDAGRLGITLEDLVGVNQKLLTSYTGAIPLTQRQASAFENNSKELGILINFYGKLGVSQEESIKVFNTFNNTMVGGVREAQRFSDSLAIFAQTTGMSANKVFQDFNANIDRFSVLGSEKAAASFQKLEMAATRLGKNVGDVIKSIEKFDDIETGFQTGGQLNRVLSFMGGSFDTFRAMQASDEERAQMLYQAISKVSDNYQNLQTTAAKRGFAKQIAESANMDLSTVLGLLNKSTNVAEDLSEIYKKPLVSEEFSDKGRERAAIRLSTTEQLGKIQGQMFELSPLVAKLSDDMKANTAVVTRTYLPTIEKIDEKYGKVFTTGGIAAFKQAGADFYKDVKDLPTEFTKIVERYNKESKEKFDTIVTNNTDAIKLISGAAGALAKGVDVRVTGELTGGPGGTKVPVSGRANVANAVDGVPIPSDESKIKGTK